MSLSTSAREFSTDKQRAFADAEAFGLRYSRPLSRPQGRGRDYRGAVTYAPVSLPAARQVPPPEVDEIEPEMPRRGLLSRLVSFLRNGASAPKQLRLAETVALGEKRFVAIIHAEGHKYLVGGGSSGVALLTRLDDMATSAEIPPTLRGPIEATR